MNAQLIKEEGLKKTLKILVSDEVVSLEVEKELVELQKVVTIQGFRKGKAPMAIVKSQYNSKVIPEAIDKALNKSLQEAMIEHKLHPVSDPKVEFGDKKGTYGFEYQAEVEVRPEFEVKGLDKLTKKISKEPVTEDTLQSVIDKHLESFIDYKPLLIDRKAQDKDRLTLDYVGKKEGIPFEGGTANGALLVLGSNSYIPGFEEGLIGASFGEKRDLNLEFPKEYHVDSLAGQPVTFEVSISKIEAPELPELNDEWVKKSFQVETVDKYKELLNQKLEQESDDKYLKELNTDLLSQLCDHNFFELPVTLVEKEKAAQMQQTIGDLARMGMPAEEQTNYLEKWKTEIDKNSEKVIRQFFIVDEIAKKEELFPTDEEISYLKSQITQLYAMQNQKQDPPSDSSLFLNLTEKKVLEFLRKKVDPDLDKDQSSSETSQP